MKNTYTNPMLDIKRFNGEDIVTSSVLVPKTIVGNEKAFNYGSKTAAEIMGYQTDTAVTSLVQ